MWFRADSSTCGRDFQSCLGLPHPPVRMGSTYYHTWVICGCPGVVMNLRLDTPLDHARPTRTRHFSYVHAVYTPACPLAAALCVPVDVLHCGIPPSGWHGTRNGMLITHVTVMCASYIYFRCLTGETLPSMQCLRTCLSKRSITPSLHGD